MRKKIIITEPSRAIMQRERSSLDRGNLTLFPSSTKEDALALHRKEKAHLIIVDTSVPAMSTEEFCAAVRKDKGLRNVSIMAVRAGDDAGRVEFFRFRPNAWVPSPVDATVFVNTVHRLLHVPHRAFFRTPLGVKFPGTRNDRAFPCYLNDISASGMLFDSEQVLNNGDKIECGFLLPDNTRVRSSAEVVRVVKKGRDYDSYKYGVRFIDLDDGMREAIEAYVRDRATRA